MYREIITSGGVLIDSTFDILKQKGIVKEMDNSLTRRKWDELLKRSGLYTPDADLDASDLFALIKYAFDTEYKTSKDVVFRTGYVYSSDFSNSIKHFEAARAYSTAKTVYMDELLSSVLFEYIAVYYLWAVNRDNLDVYSFCFRTALYLLDSCFRKGNLDSDECKAEIVEMISKHCPDAAPSVISDIYWSALAFAMCHELAHIYHGHIEVTDNFKSLNWQLEYDADMFGGRVFLNLICGKYSEFDSPFHEVFHSYTYTAPEILFLLYEDVYFMEQWMYGELPDDSYPDIRSRIDRLLELSISQEFSFDTEEGNAVLASHWEISDLFREEFFLKLKNGKLEKIKRKGADTTMAGNGYEEAYAFDEYMCSQVRQMAEEEHVSKDKAVGLWNIAAQIDIVGGNECRSLVWSDGKKAYSSKAINVFFNQKAVLEAIIESGLTLALPNDKFATIRFALLILFKLYKISTIELSDDMVKLLMECHKRNAYRIGLNTSELLKTTGVEIKVLNKLYELHCVHFKDDGDTVYLDEKVLINQPIE